MSSSAGGSNRKTKRERREEMARKRDERAVRAAHRKERKAQAYLADDANFASFATQLACMGLKLRDIPGDGNCLFRALGDQLDGHGKNHLKHREDVVKYMQEHRQDFEPFVEDDIPFERHIANLRKPGTYAGNDAIVAFARLHKLTVVIHQMNSPLWQIQGNDDKNAKQLHISYHNGDHYSSVRKMNDHSQNPTSIKLKADGTPLDDPTLEIKSKFQSKTPMTSYQNGYSGASQYKVYHDNAIDQFSWCPVDEGEEEGGYSVGESGFTGHGLSTYSTNEVDGAHVARAMRDVDAIVRQISHETGCGDLTLIKDALEDNFMDTGATVAFITQIMATQDVMTVSQDSGIWSPDGTGTRIFGDSGTGTKPKQKLSSTQVKRNKKQEKKQRAMERHKVFVLGKAGIDSNYYGSNSKESSDEDAMIVKSLKTLNI